MKMKRKLILMSVLSFSLLLVITSAFIISGPDFRIRGAISGGGVSGEYKSKIITGQSIIGTTGTISGGNRVCFGLFCVILYYCKQETDCYHNQKGKLSWWKDIGSHTISTWHFIENFLLLKHL